MNEQREKKNQVDSDIVQVVLENISINERISMNYLYMDYFPTEGEADIYLAGTSVDYTKSDYEDLLYIFEIIHDEVGISFITIMFNEDSSVAQYCDGMFSVFDSAGNEIWYNVLG